MWCIPPDEDAHFVCQMEQVLEVYKRPYDPKQPVICMDEMPKQLICETRIPVPTAPNQPARFDYEYKRQGVACVWMFTEPLAGWRMVEVTDRRTAVDWAERLRALVDDPRYRQAERITLVSDNLNTHNFASFYQAFEPAEALRIARRLELIYTPKHGSWLNIAECELGVLDRQCMDRRIGEPTTMRQEAKAWEQRRNSENAAVDWRFTTDNARIKLKRLYPKTMG